MWALSFLLAIGFVMADECKVLGGYASWYGGKFHGRKTSSGEAFDKYKYTAASKHFKMHSYVLVRNLENGKEVVVRINDKGPYKKGRIIDLSKSAAEKLGMLTKGVVKVQVLPLACAAKEDTEEIIADLMKTD
ncbi:septal ring lytic transglycosylase RlpA family protein [Thermocrinis jamiesonii]|jgi:rare lipoprotein A|uniref:septal ring lytic transglycosylase RlpA family protein n=1 Tax=Thermocrinis jamiesonii TaxID=1302351 RepID=UPI00056FE7EC|nr:septal ring lytic transglycosylase RlpA family protein [Thermocrinis jamiesonii]